MTQAETAKYVTAVIVNYWRFSRAHKYIATEAGWGISADVLSSDGKSVYETEVKVDKHDFLRDFKKHKHFTYERALGNKVVFCPKRFYFAVPESLSEWALETLESRKSKYGLIVVKVEGAEGYLSERAKVLKRAKKLHDEPVSTGLLDNIITRGSSQLAILLEKKYLNDERKERLQ